MIYEWKTGYFPVKAQTAGEELERIAAERPLTAQAIVEESRAETAPLHPCFEWDDTAAAEKYREQQARVMTANLVAVKVCGYKPSNPVRAFVHLQGAYTPVTTAVQSVSLRSDMLSDALREMQEFKLKYSTLSELADVFSAIDDALAEVR